MTQTSRLSLIRLLLLTSQEEVNLMTTAEKIAIEVSMQGHDRLAGRWEKQARWGDAKAKRLYLHHLEKWCELNQKLKEES